MQLPWYEHFHEIVIPAWQAYLAAEQRLTDALGAENDVLIERARYDVLREGGAAAFYVHHFGEVILRARPDWLPREVTDPICMMKWLADACTMLRSGDKVADVTLLRDVADALKHAILTRRLRERDVAENDAVIVIGRGFGELRYGEGKFGGVDEVWILAKSGPRVLSSVLQNVIDAWREKAGIRLPAIGAP